MCQEMGESTPRRRQFLAVIGSVGTGMIAGCAGGYFGNQDTGELTPTDEPGVGQRALAYAEEHYPEYRDRLVEFLKDEKLDDRFIDEQTGLWVSAPDSVWRGERQYFDYPRRILANGLLYANDWNMNGVPHLLPDGTPGPDFEDPFTPVDGDAFVRRFYNVSGQVHDVRTGEYLGFQPESGDTVGKLGDREGEGSIAAYLDGDVTPKDLTGRMITVTWTDTARSPAVIYEAFDIIRQYFAEDPPGDTRIDFYGINGVTRQGVEPPPSTVADGNEAITYYEQNVPDELKGPVNYMIFVEEENDRITGSALDSSPSPGGIGNHAGDDPDTVSPPLSAAYLTLHELYWHGLTGMPHISAGEDDGPYTADDPEDFTATHWEHILDAMNAQNRAYYTPLT